MKTVLNPFCCKSFGTLATKYLDFTYSDDENLRLISSLLDRVTDEEPLNSRESKEVGFQISQYLRRKAVLEHFIFHKTLRSTDVGDLDAIIELKRISRKFI